MSGVSIVSMIVADPESLAKLAEAITDVQVRRKQACSLPEGCRARLSLEGVSPLPAECPRCGMAQYCPHGGGERMSPVGGQKQAEQIAAQFLADLPPKSDYTRDELIAICERGIVPQEQWLNRDSAGAQRQLGEAWSLLKAGCLFRVLTSGSLITNEDTIWVEFTINGFNFFESGQAETETAYLPTPARLARSQDEDWY